MRSAWNIFRDDVRHAFSNVVAVVVMLALCLMPAAFAWVNIAGCWDPNSNTGNLKVAIANCDEGYESDLVPVEMNVGDRIVNALREDDDYSWVFLGEDEALDGLRSGEYYAAIVIPADFSSGIMSALSSGDEVASISYYLNMKENPVASVVSGEGSAGVAEGVRAKFNEAVDAMSVGLASDLIAYASGDHAEDFGTRLVGRLGDVADDLDAAADKVRMFSSLADAASSLTSATASSLTGSEDAADASKGVVAQSSEALDAAIELARSSAGDIEQQVKNANSSDGLAAGIGTEKATQLVGDIGTLASSVEAISSQASTMAQSLQDMAASLADSTDSVASDLDSVRDDLGKAANKLSASASKIRKFQDDVASAVAKGDYSLAAGVIGNSSSSMAAWLAAPVQLDGHAVFAVESYGSSMAPFFSVLAIWIGAVLLAFMLKASVSESRLRRYEEARGRQVRNWEQYLGRYFFFTALVLLQATIMALGEIALFGVQCAHPMLFVVACWVCAIVFSSIVFTMCLLFGGVGKALCLVMLALQVVGMGGEFPIPMMGDFFQVVYSFMPFTYGVGAMQEAIAGVYGMEFAFDLLKLAAFLVPSLLLGLAARRPITRFMEYFGRKLGQTGVM